MLALKIWRRGIEDAVVVVVGGDENEKEDDDGKAKINVSRPLLKKDETIKGLIKRPFQGELIDRRMPFS